jgi:hypothetical protein
MSFSNEMTKSAGGAQTLAKILHGLYTGASKGVRFAGQHPKATVGIIGAGMLGSYSLGKILDLSERVHPLYNIVENERKRGIMNQQVELLSGILDAQKKLSADAPKQEPPKFIAIKPSLL